MLSSVFVFVLWLRLVRLSLRLILSLKYEFPTFITRDGWEELCQELFGYTIQPADHTLTGSCYVRLPSNSSELCYELLTSTHSPMDPVFQTSLMFVPIITGHISVVFSQ